MEMDKRVNEYCPVPKMGQDNLLNSVLNVEVSCFANYTSPNKPKPVNLLLWLLSKKYQIETEYIREIVNKKERDMLKAKLPAITPSGMFSKRTDQALIKHSGLLQFDIDFKDNQHIVNYRKLKQQLCNIINVAYCGLSVSGSGYWGLIPIAYPEKHREHFEGLKKVFKKFEINIDPCCKDISRLRGYSFDPEGYFNHKAKIFFKYESQDLPQKGQLSFTKTNYNSVEGILANCIAIIVREQIDITSNYQNWFKIGCSLANFSGESGREYFHALSRIHLEYDFNKTNKQFDSCLKKSYKYTINTLFYYCKSYGVKIE